MRSQIETRWEIVEALDSLMESTPIDKIKVTRLCKAAAISRTTFYEYFDNIYDVATWAWDQILDETLHQIGLTYTFVAAHERFFETILERRGFYGRAFRTHDYNSIMNYGYRTMLEWYLEQIPKRINRSLTEEERMIARIFTAGVAYHTSAWVQEGMQQTPRFMARAFAASAPGIFDCLK